MVNRFVRWGELRPLNDDQQLPYLPAIDQLAVVYNLAILHLFKRVSVQILING